MALDHSIAHSAWYRSLDPDKKRAIRKLHHLNPYWNLVGPLFILIWAATGALMLNFDSWWIRIPGYLLIGTIIHALASIMHEGIHGLLFRNRQWDRWWGFVMGAPSLFSLSAYGVNHLLHHKYTRTERDPDEFTNVSPHRRVVAIFFYVWIVFGILIYELRVPYIAGKNALPRERRQMIVEHALLLSLAGAILAAACWYGFFSAVAQVWLIPMIVGTLIGNIQGWAEHPLTPPGHPFTQTRTVTSNRLFSFFNINLNYHLEHHLFPGIPWYNLPKVHRLLLEDYRAAGASIYRSYAVYLYDAFRLGVYGLTPIRTPAATAEHTA